MNEIPIESLPPLDTDSTPDVYADDTTTVDRSALIMLTGFEVMYRFNENGPDLDEVNAALSAIPAEHQIAASAPIIDSLLALLHSRAGLTPTESLSIVRQHLIARSK